MTNEIEYEYQNLTGQMEELRQILLDCAGTNEQMRQYPSLLAEIETCGLSRLIELARYFGIIR